MGKIMEKNNYEITRDLMEAEFCKYDQEKMIEKFQLQYDEEYLYIDFVGQNYRINRTNGRVERGTDQFLEVFHGDYNESMSIFDLLCYSKEYCCLSGKYCGVNSLRKTVQTAFLGEDLNQHYAEFFDQRPEALERALAALGGTKEPVGDISYKVYPFPYLPVIVQFWKSDEEFPASIKILWDENTLDFMHYETTYYVAGHLMKRLKELC